MGEPFDRVRTIARDLPGVVEGTSYGTPALKAGRKLLTRLREDGDSLVVRIGFDERDMLIMAEPATFYITDHYRDYPMVLVRLSRIDDARLRRLLTQSWRAMASKRHLAAYDASAAN